jgi:two-component system response regulator PhoP
MRILLIEDEISLNEFVKKNLEVEGFAVDAATGGINGEFLGIEHPYDAAIVDIGLPDKSGLDVIKHWRSKGIKFPVIILTALGRWQEKVTGLEAGADDYLVKPFHVEELIARLRALIRRASDKPNPVLQFGNITLDTAKQEIRVAEQKITLTAYEYKLIEFLMTHPDQVYSKTQLIEHIYNQDFDLDSNVIEVFIGRIRKKLDPDGSLNPIETLRGRGYRFRSEPK